MDIVVKRSRPVIAAAVTAAAVVGCTAGGSAPASPSAHAVDTLLQRPMIRPSGAGCPITRKVTRPTSITGDVLGDGPARPTMGPVLEYTGDGPGSAFAGSGWGGAKVLWIAAPNRGPVVIRGQRLDGDDRVAFDGTDGRPVENSIVIPPRPSAADWRDRPSYIRLRVPGCYSFQIDTLTGSTSIVFRAVGPTVGP
jgi:hypothetical protein